MERPDTARRNRTRSTSSRPRCEEARDGGAKDAARLSIIAVGNYVWMTQDWPQLIERANALLNELDNTLSRRWG